MTVTMKANRIQVFGGPEVILFEDMPRPTAGTGEALVRVHAAGVVPWDAWVRAGRSAGSAHRTVTPPSGNSKTMIFRGTSSRAAGSAVRMRTTSRGWKNKSWRAGLMA